MTVDPDLIVPLDPAGTAPPLFCVHASSGSAYSYLGLARLLGPDQPVYGIEAPGFDGDRSPVRSLPALAAEYAETVHAFRSGGDVALLGWSLGGIIALETARRLTAAGTRIRHVVLVDVSVPWVAALPPEQEIVRRFLLEFLATIGAPAALDQLPPGRPEDIFRSVERSGVLPPELDADFLTDRYTVFRALVEASYGFEVTEPYPGRVTHLIATDSPRPAMNWSPLAPDITEHTIPGTHHTIWTGPALQILAARTRTALAT